MILKPLDGYGGRGVIVLEKEASQNINSILDFYISGRKESNYVILQEYVEGADKGDARVLMLNGEPLGAYRRNPSQDDIRSNIRAGGDARKHQLTKEEKKLCKKIGPKLVADLPKITCTLKDSVMCIHITKKMMALSRFSLGKFR